MPETQQRSSVVTFCAAALAVAAIVFFLRQAIVPELRSQRQTLEQLAKDVEAVKLATRLLRFEKQPGSGFEAILEHLRFWTAQSAKLGGSIVDRPHIDARLQEGLDALLGLGRSAYPQAEVAFLAADTGDEEPLRRILLKALVKLDPERGVAFADRVLRRKIERAVTFAMRLYAADELLAADAAKAGEALKDIMLSEYVRGSYRDLKTGAEEYSNPGFFNFVPRFLQSPYPQKEDVLLQMLQNTLHDVPTLQEVMEGVGKMKTKEAVEKIKEFVESRGHPSHANPLFRSKAARTLAMIQGADACAYFREQVALEKDETVKKTLSSLIKENCR